MDGGGYHITLPTVNISRMHGFNFEALSGKTSSILFFSVARPCIEHYSCLAPHTSATYPSPTAVALAHIYLLVCHPICTSCCLPGRKSDQLDLEVDPCIQVASIVSSLEKVGSMVRSTTRSNHTPSMWTFATRNSYLVLRHSSLPPSPPSHTYQSRKPMFLRGIVVCPNLHTQLSSGQGEQACKHQHWSHVHELQSISVHHYIFAYFPLHPSLSFGITLGAGNLCGTYFFNV